MRLLAALGRHRAEHRGERGDGRGHRGAGDARDHAVRERELRDPEVARDRSERDHRRHPGMAAHPAELGRHDDRAQQQRRGERRARRGRPQQVTGQDVLGEGRVQLDAVGQRIERRRDLVVGRERQPDERELAGERAARRGAVEHPGRGHAR